MDSTAPVIVAALLSITLFSLAVLVLRFWCKGRNGAGRFGWDDYVVSLAWVCLFTYTILILCSCKYGMGQHLKNISPTDLPTALMLSYIGRFFGIIALAFSKSSFAVTLLRLTIDRWQRIVLWFIILSLNISLGLCALFLFVQCTPVEKAYILSTPGSCWPQQVTIGFSIFAGVYSTIMDFTLALFPWFLVWKLQMRTVEKFGVAFAMSLGILAGITAAIKTSYLTDTSRNNDFTYTSQNLLIWSGSETAVTIVAASIPFFRVLIRDVSRSLVRKNYQDTGYNLDVMSGGSTTTNIRTVTAARGRRVAPGQPDDWSDKSILGSDEGRNGDNVVVHKEFKISYQGQDSVRSPSDVSLRV